MGASQLVVTYVRAICRFARCLAAASDLTAQQTALQGDADVPIITGLLNTVEWLTDYNNFYEKRYALCPLIRRRGMLCGICNASA